MTPQEGQVHISAMLPSWPPFPGKPMQAPYQPVAQLLGSVPHIRRKCMPREDQWELVFPITQIQGASKHMLGKGSASEKITIAIFVQTPTHLCFARPVPAHINHGHSVNHFEQILQVWILDLSYCSSQELIPIFGTDVARTQYRRTCWPAALPLLAATCFLFPLKL